MHFPFQLLKEIIFLLYYLIHISAYWPLFRKHQWKQSLVMLWMLPTNCIYVAHCKQLGPIKRRRLEIRCRSYMLFVQESIDETLFFFRHYQWETQSHLGYLVADNLAFWNSQFKWVFVRTKFRNEKKDQQKNLKTVVWLWQTVKTTFVSGSGKGFKWILN